MNLELTAEEARFLRAQLARHLQTMENELIHTDKHQLQHELARDLEKMRAIETRVSSMAAAY